MEKKTEPLSCDINAKACCSTPETNAGKDLKSHWDRAYNNAPVNKLGWHEEKPEPSFRLIDICNFNKNASLLNIGAGATTLVDGLLERGYKNVIANDISPAALQKLKDRLGEKQELVQWVEDDITMPKKLNDLPPVDLWHDRAVLHFFMEKKEQDAYFDLLKKMLKPKGFAIIATFNLNGAKKCSGLPVFRYDQNMLHKKLGQEFELIQEFDHIYEMPSGDTREYVYTLFQRSE